jgi:hypothetical protein
MKKKKIILTLIVCAYIIIISGATLFVPVKATVHKGDTDDPDADAMEEMGYYPIWEVLGKNATAVQKDSGLRVTIILNTTAWIIQYVFLTLLFVSMLYQTHRYFKR